MNRTEILERVQSRFGERILEADLDAHEPFIRVAPAGWPDVATFLRDDCGMDHLTCLTAIDRGDGLEAVYNLEHMGPSRDGISVRVGVSYDEPEIPTVESVWRTADWHEREAFDLMGIRFAGHHNLKRILCAEDWVGHPLRKDYESPDHYHGIRNNVV